LRKGKRTGLVRSVENLDKVRAEDLPKTSIKFSREPVPAGRLSLGHTLKSRKHLLTRKRTLTDQYLVHGDNKVTYPTKWTGQRGL